MPDPVKLTAFEGREVASAKIEIPNAAGGLREAMKFEPREWQHDEEFTIVMKVRVRKVRFDEIKDTNALTRIHVLDALEAAFIDDESVEAALIDQRERIQRAKEEEAGVQRLPTDEELHDQHQRGNHFTIVDGCVDCAEEEDARRAGD